MTVPSHGVRRGWDGLQPFWKLIAVVVGSALLTVVALGAGLETIAGTLSFVHLSGLIGAPLGMALQRQLRSLAVVVAVSIGLSVAMTALAAQLLLWFGLSERPLLIVTATAYGLVVSVLVVDPTEPFRRAPG